MRFDVKLIDEGEINHEYILSLEKHYQSSSIIRKIKTKELKVESK